MAQKHAIISDQTFILGTYIKEASCLIRQSIPVRMTLFPWKEAYNLLTAVIRGTRPGFNRTECSIFC
ncbi:MAG TPA: hypothetical protein PLR22_09180 [Saprospiraceae bacterium]|nr:hypothetical protein [Saprospiraceae bacterium]